MKKLYIAIISYFTILVVGGLLASTYARAETTVGIHIGSQHVDADEKFNNFNPGVYINHDGWTAGTYYNSIKKQSFYAGYTFEYPIGPVRAGLTIGAISGYNVNPVAPLVAPSVRMSVAKDIGVRLFYLPKVKFTGAHVFHLTMEKTF